MIAHVVAAPVAGRELTLSGHDPSYVDLDGFVVVVVGPSGPLLPNGVVLTDRPDGRAALARRRDGCGTRRSTTPPTPRASARRSSKPSTQPSQRGRLPYSRGRLPNVTRRWPRRPVRS